jgi:subtilisin
VSGTIAALNNTIDVVGVAPGATLHAVKVLNQNGSGTWSGVIAGIDWVASDKLSSVVIANMSLGGSGSKGTGTCTAKGYAVGSGSPDAMYQSLCTAANKGVLFSVAAGNSGANAATFVPAAYYDAVITVSAMGINAQTLYDWPNWSNWGIINDAGSGITTPTAPVSITAPGVSILSLKAGGGTTTLSGTSMATPHVTGALALFVYQQTFKGLMQSGYAALGQARTGLLVNSDPACPYNASCSAGWTNSSGNPHYENFLDVLNLY